MVDIGSVFYKQEIEYVNFLVNEQKTGKPTFRSRKSGGKYLCST